MRKTFSKIIILAVICLFVVSAVSFAQVNKKCENADQADVKKLGDLIVKNNYDEFKKLIEEKPGLVKLYENVDYTALHNVVAWDRVNMAKLLIEKGASVNAAAADGKTPLHFAAAIGSPGTEMLELLISNGAKINALDIDKNTPLHYAVSSGRINTVNFFIKNKADINAKNAEGVTPLYVACRSGAYEIAAALIDKGADVKQASNKGYTPLHAASSRGYSMIVVQPEEILMSEKLYKLYKKLGGYDSSGAPPMIDNGRQGRAKIASLLIDKGADVNAKSKAGFTPLHIAAVGGYPEALELLLSKNADVNAAANQGSTPLHLAAREANKDAVEILLKKGADKKLKNKLGQTPADVAAKTLEDYKKQEESGSLAAAVKYSYRSTSGNPKADIESIIKMLK